MYSTKHVDYVIVSPAGLSKADIEPLLTSPWRAVAAAVLIMMGELRMGPTVQIRVRGVEQLAGGYSMLTIYVFVESVLIAVMLRLNQFFAVEGSEEEA